MSAATQDLPREHEVLLRCERLVIGYGGRGLLPPFDLSIRPGRLLIVAGRNGAGKSTWLKTLLGLLPPVSGNLHYSTPRPRMVYVPQSAALDEALPVRAGTVVSWGRLRGWGFLRPMGSRADRVAQRRALEQAGATDLANRRFRDLSGGERQRILFARLLAGEADIAVLDEPTASMDLNSQSQAYQHIGELARMHNMAVIVVTHTLSVAARYADEALFLHRGATVADAVVASGAPETVFAHPLLVRLFGQIWAGAGDRVGE